MQDITDLPFMKVVAAFGGADLYITEYFRVHIHSNLNPYILRSITENPTGKPILAQMIGQDAAELARTTRELKKHPVAGIDLNLGCPAPVVCRKDAGGGLLRNPDQIDRILGALSEECGDLPLTVKTRLGYDSPEEFDRILEVFAKHPIQLLTIHGRTVKERYQTPVHPAQIHTAAQRLTCPVIANGNVVNCTTGLQYLASSKAAGLMIGRGAIRQPWIFQQLRNILEGKKNTPVTNQQTLHYIRLLFEETAQEMRDYVEVKHVNKMKKYLIFIVQGHPPELEYYIRRAKTKEELFTVCEAHLNNTALAPDLPPENSKLFCGFSQFLDS